MQIETKEMVIFLRDDGISLQYPDGQCAGYGIDGNMLIFMGQSCELSPTKIILHDQRTTNFTHK